MAYVILSVLAFACSVVLLIGAAVTGNVLVRLLRRGPAAAREAFEHGDSLGNWWHARAPEGAGSHGLRARRSLAGRYDKDLGVVAVEERASQPTYIR